MPDLRTPARLPLLIIAMLSLLGGVLAGLARLAWGVPALAVNAAGWHGALMITAFLGTVISLERAVAIGERWAYLAPAAAGLGGLLALAGQPILLTHLLSVLAALIMLGATTRVLQRLVAPFTVVLSLGAACWLAGNLVWWITGVISVAVSWWLAFLVLTIAGERLEMTRFLPTPKIAQTLFFWITGSMLLGATVVLFSEPAGLALFSVSLLALALWLLRYDIARHNIRQHGLTRFIAACLLSGYLWLLLAGLIGLAGGFNAAHPWRDAALHAVCLGFVFAMIFGHAPIIFPAVARVKIPYSPVFYLPLLLLHASLALRVSGVLQNDFALRRTGGLCNAVALLLFIAVMLYSIRRGRKIVPQPQTS
ncbi:hypothetical protein [Leeia oryzae]|uniref:hypothetical protein n=1 Tax=Leeia oryzae TaxID=356662 RepID=UPI000375A074|nr:hypothetical protein [Leeia oryzae]